MGSDPRTVAWPPGFCGCCCHGQTPGVWLNTAVHTNPSFMSRSHQMPAALGSETVPATWGRGTVWGPGCPWAGIRGRHWIPAPSPTWAAPQYWDPAGGAERGGALPALGRPGWPRGGGEGWGWGTGWGGVGEALRGRRAWRFPATASFSPLLPPLLSWLTDHFRISPALLQQVAGSRPGRGRVGQRFSMEWEW